MINATPHRARSAVVWMLAVFALACFAGAWVTLTPGCAAIEDPAKIQQRREELDRIAKAAAAANAAADSIAAKLTEVEAVLTPAVQEAIEALPEGDDKAAALSMLAELSSTRERLQGELTRTKEQRDALVAALEHLPGVIGDDGSIDFEKLGAIVVGAGTSVPGPWSPYVAAVAAVLGLVGAVRRLIKANKRANENEEKAQETQLQLAAAQADFRSRLAEEDAELKRLREIAQKIVLSLEKAKEQSPALQAALEDATVRTELRLVQGETAGAFVDSVQRSRAVLTRARPVTLAADPAKVGAA